MATETVRFQDPESGLWYTVPAPSTWDQLDDYYKQVWLSTVVDDLQYPVKRTIDVGNGQKFSFQVPALAEYMSEDDFTKWVTSDSFTGPWEAGEWDDWVPVAIHREDGITYTPESTEYDFDTVSKLEQPDNPAAHGYDPTLLGLPSTPEQQLPEGFLPYPVGTDPMSGTFYERPLDPERQDVANQVFYDRITGDDETWASTAPAVALKGVAGDRVARLMGAPYAAELMHQQSQQAFNDRPLTSAATQIVPQLIGGAGVVSGIRAAIPAAARGTAAVLGAVNNASRGVRAAATVAGGGAAGVGGGAYNAGVNARSGEEGPAVQGYFSDPIGVGIDAGVGAGLYGMGGLAKRLMSRARGGTPSSGTGAPTGTRAPVPPRPGEGPYRVTHNPTPEQMAYAIEETGVPIPSALMGDGLPKMSGVSGRPIRQSVADAQTKLQTYLDGVTQSIGNVPPSRGAASQSLRSSITDSLEARRQALSDGYTQLFTREVDDQILTPLGNGLTSTLSEVMARRAARGAGGVPDVLADVTRLSQRGNASLRGLHDARIAIREYIRRPDDFGLTQADVTDLRDVSRSLTESIEGVLDQHAVVPDEAIAQLRQLDIDYADISDEIRDLQKRAGRSDEGMLSTVQSAFSSGGDDAINRLKRYREEGGEAFDDVVALTIDRMGRDGSGQFNGVSFANNWSHMAQDAKEAMFTPEHLRALDSIATLSPKVQDAAVKAGSAGVSGADSAAVGTLLTPIGGTGMDVAVGAAWVARFMRNRYLSKPASAKAIARYMERVNGTSSMAPSAAQLESNRARREFVAKMRSLGYDMSEVVGSTAAAYGMGITAAEQYNQGR